MATLKPGMFAKFHRNSERTMFTQLNKITTSGQISSGAIVFLVAKDELHPDLWICVYKGNFGLILEKFLRPIS